MSTLSNFFLLFKKKIFSLSLGISIVIGMIILYISQPAFFQHLDNKIYDRYLTSRPQIIPSNIPVIIDIDEEALTLYGQWPWPRYRMAALVKNAIDKGAAVVALDILLAEPDRSSPENLQKTLQHDMGIFVDFIGLPEGFKNYDELFLHQIKGLPTVLGMFAHFTLNRANDRQKIQQNTLTSARNFPPGLSIIEMGSPNALPLRNKILTAQNATVPLELFWDAAPVGLINMNSGSDGFVRQIPLAIILNNKLYLNLALRALMVALDEKNIVCKTNADGLESLHVGEIIIPVTPEGEFLVPFTGPKKEYPYISATKLLDGSLADDAFDGKILFIGTSAHGLLDVRSTPFDPVYPGVEVHAAILDALLTGRSLSLPPWAPGFQVLGILFLGLFSSRIFAASRLRVYIPIAILLLAGVLYASYSLFLQGMFVSPLYIAVTIFLEGVALLVLRFWQEEQQKNTLRKAFSLYVAPEIVRRITENPSDLLSGEERELSIMFTDIRNFTSISEHLDPRQAVSLLNRYFTPMTALVRNNYGTLDKFIGDALMAFWNAPLPVNDHAVKAVETSLAMQKCLFDMNEELLYDFGCSLRMGIGIHTGKAYVGNMGSEDLLNYTLIGDNVNLASRLEGLCPQFGIQTVISEATLVKCKESSIDAMFLPLDTLRVKGREQPVAVFAALSTQEWNARQQEFDKYFKALDFYKSQSFKKAEKIFYELKEEYPDNRLYHMYSARIGAIRIAPPVDWDGVWRFPNT